MLQPGPKPCLSTDGWNGYPNAVDNAFAGRADYGQIIKTFGEADPEEKAKYSHRARAVRAMIASGALERLPG